VRVRVSPTALFLYQNFEDLKVEKNISFSASGVNTLEIFLSKEEIRPFIEEGFRKIQQNVNVPGFRPGKVPRQMLEKMYGKAVENDSHIDIVNEYFPKIAKRKISFLSTIQTSKIFKKLTMVLAI